jgi:hypothetical protein
MDDLEELRSLVGWLLLEVFVLVFHRFWVVHFGGKLCRIFGRDSSKVGPTGPPRIPGWSLGRVLSPQIPPLHISFLFFSLHSPLPPHSTRKP